MMDKVKAICKNCGATLPIPDPNANPYISDQAREWMGIYTKPIRETPVCDYCEHKDGE